MDDDNDDCLTPGTACATIGAAVGKAASGDTIEIAAGTYNEHDIEVYDELTLNGAGMENTIVDAGAAGRAFRVGATVVISNLRIQNGQTSAGDIFDEGGSAVLTGGSAHLTLQNAALVDNYAVGNGGAIFNVGTLVMEHTCLQQPDQHLGQRHQWRGVRKRFDGLAPQHHPGLQPGEQLLQLFPAHVAGTQPLSRFHLWPDPEWRPAGCRSAARPAGRQWRSFGWLRAGPATEKYISISVTGDTGDELDEAFAVYLSSPVNADLLDAEATGTIVDDDGLPALAIAD